MNRSVWRARLFATTNDDAIGQGKTALVLCLLAGGMSGLATLGLRLMQQLTSLSQLLACNELLSTPPLTAAWSCQLPLVASQPG